MNNITFILGDWSNDGHGKTSSYSFTVNCTAQNLEKYFKLGVKELGYDITNYCAEYEDSSIPLEFIDTLTEFGYKFISNEVIEYIEKSVEYEDYISIREEDYLNIYFYTCSIGYNDLVYEALKDEKIYLGGYGLFY